MSDVCIIWGENDEGDWWFDSVWADIDKARAERNRLNWEMGGNCGFTYRMITLEVVK